MKTFVSYKVFEKNNSTEQNRYRIKKRPYNSINPVHRYVILLSHYGIKLCPAEINSERSNFIRNFDLA